MSQQILEALKKLDVNNDAHWTQDGLPRLETVRLFAGNQALTRENITAVASDFTRLVAYNAQQAAQAAPAPAPVAAATPETQPSAQETPAAVTPAADPAPSAVLEQAPAPTRAAEAEAEFEGLSKQEQLEILQGEIAEMDQYLDAVRKRRDELRAKADDLIIAIDKETPKNSNQADIRAYLNSQNRQLAARAQQIANVRKVESELGARLSDLVPKRSPIDQAMSRKVGYGRNRPGN